jgi:hypothetical protein
MTYRALLWALHRKGRNFAAVIWTIFAKQKPIGVERVVVGDPNLNGERNTYENGSCSDDG